MDLGSALYPALYQIFGTPLTFVSPRDGSNVTITAIDETAGSPISLHEIETGTVKPCAVIRVNELAANNIKYSDMEGVDVTLNRETWSVVSVQLASGPSGELDGEAYLMLSSLANV